MQHSISTFRRNRQTDGSSFFVTMSRWSRISDETFGFQLGQDMV